MPGAVAPVVRVRRAAPLRSQSVAAFAASNCRGRPGRGCVGWSALISPPAQNRPLYSHGPAPPGPHWPRVSCTHPTRAFATRLSRGRLRPAPCSTGLRTAGPPVLVVTRTHSPPSFASLTSCHVPCAPSGRALLWPQAPPLQPQAARHPRRSASHAACRAAPRCAFTHTSAALPPRMCVRAVSASLR
jgi:hypothetical protein